MFSIDWGLVSTKCLFPGRKAMAGLWEELGWSACVARENNTTHGFCAISMTAALKYHITSMLKTVGGRQPCIATFFPFRLFDFRLFDVVFTMNSTKWRMLALMLFLDELLCHRSILQLWLVVLTDQEWHWHLPGAPFPPPIWSIQNGCTKKAVVLGRKQNKKRHQAQRFFTRQPYEATHGALSAAWEWEQLKKEAS